jgi:flavin reductase (NADH)
MPTMPILKDEAVTIMTDTLEPTTHSFRAAMANLSASVNVVTTDGPAGRTGMTVSAVCSVTDSPPTLLVCINESSRSHQTFVDNGRLCVNVLGEQHEEMAMCFAGSTGLSGEDRFADPRWDERDGLPVLADAAASVTGRIVGATRQGSHSVLFVEIEGIAVDADRGALVYFQRRFHPIAPAHREAV